MLYDKRDKNSIYQYAQKLKDKTFNTVCDEDFTFLSEQADREKYKNDFRNNRRKGGLGELIEERFFHYQIDNKSRSDFPEANLELKVTPYKINKDKSVSAKERLSISMINFMDIVKTSFYDSNAWEKIENILLIYYEWNPELKDRLDYIIRFIYLYSPSEEDLAIIINDYKIIQNKVIQGLAHELSEGDTMYLGAATKSSSSKNKTAQPFSHIKAKPRAFSLKNSYMTHLLRNEIIPSQGKQDKIIQDEGVTNFEEYVLNKINQYTGQRTEDLYKKLIKNGKYGDSKSTYSKIAYAILGVKTKKAEEFEKANIKVKTIRLNLKKSGGYSMKESISFPAFKIEELMEETWEDSSIKQQFESTKYLFVIYRETSTGFILEKAQLWNMPMSHIEGALQAEWRRARNVFREGIHFIKKPSRIENNLPKSSNTEILHVRPHADKAAYRIKSLGFEKGDILADGDRLPNGDYMTKQCFWLNNHYILQQLDLK